MTLSQRTLIKGFLPVLLIFILVNSFSIIFRNALKSWNIDNLLVISGNLVLFFVTAVSFFLYRKALLAANTQVFLRNVYSGMMLKLFVCMIAVFIYISASGGQVNKPGLFTVMFLYLVYTFIEVAIVLKQSKQIKQRNNA